MAVHRQEKKEESCENLSRRSWDRSISLPELGWSCSFMPEAVTIFQPAQERREYG
jgi:hypothetical protein